MLLRPGSPRRHSSRLLRSTFANLGAQGCLQPYTDYRLLEKNTFSTWWYQGHWARWAWACPLGPCAFRRGVLLLGTRGAEFLLDFVRMRRIVIQNRKLVFLSSTWSVKNLARVYVAGIVVESGSWKTACVWPSLFPLAPRPSKTFVCQLPGLGTFSRTRARCSAPGPGPSRRTQGVGSG